MNLHTSVTWDVLAATAVSITAVAAVATVTTIAVMSVAAAVRYPDAVLAVGVVPANIVTDTHAAVVVVGVPIARNPDAYRNGLVVAVRVVCVVMTAIASVGDRYVAVVAVVVVIVEDRADYESANDASDDGLFLAACLGGLGVGKCEGGGDCECE